MSHAPGSFLPAFICCSAKPMLVIELEMSIRIGSPDVGSPAAIGFGVMIGVRPPCGTTAKTVGSELCTIATRPRSVARNR
jgi:hypothetical protein